MTEKIIIGSDHAGFAAKEAIKLYLIGEGYEVEDVGCHSEASVHYPAYARLVAQAVSKGQVPRGILVCGTGIGMSIAANKYFQVRAAVVHDEFTAQAAKEHNNANVLCLGSRCLDVETMKRLVNIWLTTEFGGGRHALRVGMIEN